MKRSRLTRAALTAAAAVATTAALAAPAHAGRAHEVGDRLRRPGADAAVQALARLQLLQAGRQRRLRGRHRRLDAHRRREGRRRQRDARSVGGAADAQSLLLPAGSSATTPPVCVGLDEPTLRYFAAQEQRPALDPDRLGPGPARSSASGSRCRSASTSAAPGTRASPTPRDRQPAAAVPARHDRGALQVRPDPRRRLADRRRLRRSAHVATSRVSSERMIDPLERWREYGEKPDYAGLLTFSGMPYTQDAAELAGVDVAIVGAPTDDLVSDRPGTRFGPRAIRAASLPARPAPRGRASTAFEVLRVVDFGDAAGPARRPGPHARRDRGARRPGRRRRRAADHPRRRPLDRRARHPRDRHAAAARSA